MARTRAGRRASGQAGVVRRVLLTIAAGLDWVMRTRVDRRVCEWANTTGED